MSNTASECKADSRVGRSYSEDLAVLGFQDLSDTRKNLTFLKQLLDMNICFLMRVADSWCEC